MWEGGESSEPEGAEEGLSDPLRWQDPGKPGHSIAQGGSEVVWAVPWQDAFIAQRIECPALCQMPGMCSQTE